MEEILVQLVKTAQAEQAVASQQLTNDMKLLVYPLEQGIVIALGYEGEFAHRMPAQELVRKRTGNLERFGSWMPAMFNDGGIYVVRRIRHLDTNLADSILSEDELLAAEELLT